MKIAILGTGCAKCHQTADIVRQAIAQAGVDATVYKVEDPREILKFRVMSTPAVAIDGTVRISGRVPTVPEVAAFLSPGGRDSA